MIFLWHQGGNIMQINLILNIINIVVIAVAFLIIFIYQRNQNKTLKIHIDTLKGTIDSIRIIADLLDPQKVKGHIELSEDRIRKEMEKQMQEMKEEYEKEILKRKDIIKKLDLIWNEFSNANAGLIDALFRIPAYMREEIINELDQNTIVAKALQAPKMQKRFREFDENFKTILSKKLSERTSDKKAAE
jgi:hypothetical protein